MLILATFENTPKGKIRAKEHSNYLSKIAREDFKIVIIETICGKYLNVTSVRVKEDSND